MGNGIDHSDGEEEEEEHTDIDHIVRAKNTVIFLMDPERCDVVMRGAVHRRMGRLLSSPPEILADVIRDLLEGYAASETVGTNTHKKSPLGSPAGSPGTPGSPAAAAAAAAASSGELETQLRSRRSLTSDLRELLGRLEEECSHIKTMSARLEQHRELRERMSKSVDAQIAAHATLVEDAKELRAADKAAKAEIAAARAASKSAKKEAAAVVREGELALAKEKANEKRLRDKLSALSSDAAVLAARAEQAERAIARDRAVAESLLAVDARHTDAEDRLRDARARLEATHAELADARSGLADARSGLAATEAAIETTLVKNEGVSRRLEGLRYRLMDAMRDVARVKDELGHAEMAAMCAAVPLWRRVGA